MFRGHLQIVYLHGQLRKLFNPLFEDGFDSIIVHSILAFRYPMQSTYAYRLKIFVLVIVSVKLVCCRLFSSCCKHPRMQHWWFC